MTEPIHKGKDLPPVWVIHAASGGDSEAMEQVLRYYDDYMSRLCTRTLYDKDGTPHVCVDNETPALNALKALRGAPISMGRGEIPVELLASSRPFFASLIFR